MHFKLILCRRWDRQDSLEFMCIALDSLLFLFKEEQWNFPLFDKNESERIKKTSRKLNNRCSYIVTGNQWIFSCVAIFLTCQYESVQRVTQWEANVPPGLSPHPPTPKESQHDSPLNMLSDFRTSTEMGGDVCHPLIASFRLCLFYDRPFMSRQQCLLSMKSTIFRQFLPFFPR